MRNIALYLLVALIAVTGCKKKETDNTFRIPTTRITEDSEASTYKMYVKNSTSWELKVNEDSRDWLSYDIVRDSKADTVLFHFKANTSILTRETMGRIRDNISEKEFNLYIRQYGEPKLYSFNPKNLIIGYDQTESSTTWSLNADKYEVEYQPSWVTDIIVEKEETTQRFDFKVKLEENEKIRFRKDSIVINATWDADSESKRAVLYILQLGNSSLETDKATLAEIYNALGGNSWEPEYRWNLESDISTWKGVTTEITNDGAGKRVVALQLSGAGLNGAIPVKIADLPYLKALWLDNNENLTGTIPEEIGELVLMENLRLGNTALSGNLPVSLSKMSALTNLAINDTGENGINGSIPTEYGELKNLNTLDFSDNNLDGELPAELGTLTELQIIDLSNNMLSGNIPSTFLNNYRWPYWDVENRICPQRGDGFTNCSK